MAHKRPGITWLADLDDEALRDLIAEAQELLDERAEVPATPPSRATVAEVRTPRGCYRQELVRCGKGYCRCAQYGPVHGPYWYWYGRANGRRVSRYVGKSLPQPAGPPD
jgi:hypothetical protein